MKTNTGINAVKHKQSGVTLIELIIVVAIIGILGALAYPSYSDQMTKTRRADAHLALLNAAQTLERCKATSYTYVGCAAAVATTTDENLYTIALTPVPTASQFTIVATAIAGQTRDTDCLEISLDHLGRQLPADCWD